MRDEGERMVEVPGTGHQLISIRGDREREGERGRRQFRNRLCQLDSPLLMTTHNNTCPTPTRTSGSSQVAALKPDGSLFFSSVTGGSGVWSWTNVTVAGAGFKTTIPRRVTWSGEGRHMGAGPRLRRPTWPLDTRGIYARSEI